MKRVVSEITHILSCDPVAYTSGLHPGVGTQVHPIDAGRAGQRPICAHCPCAIDLSHLQVASCTSPCLLLVLMLRNVHTRKVESLEER